MGSPAVTAPPPAAPSAPSAPAAPAAPASPPPSSAPVSAPVAPPAPVSAPVAPPAPYDPKTAPAPPKNTDYPNTTDGQAEFASQMNRWHREHPEGEKAPIEAPPAPAQTPEEKALADAQPADAPKPPAAPEVAATPQALAEMMESTPAFKDVLEANPKVKGQVFQMARELAAAKPITEIFPSVDDAKFAQEYSSNMVGLKTASLRLANSPETSGEFLEMFDSQFAQVKADGTPVTDETGKPVYDSDRDAVRGAIFNARLSEVSAPMVSEIASLETKLKGAYPSDFARNQDQNRLDNLKYAQTALEVIPSILDGSFFDGDAPEPPTDATPEQKQWFEQQKADLAKQKQDLDDQKKGASKEERTATAAKFNSAVRTDMGTSAGDVIRNSLKAIVDSGTYIPEFYMQEKYVGADGKETGTSAIGVRLFQQFENELYRPGSRTLLEMTNHELLPQNDQTREIRKNWYARKASEIMPGLVQKEVDRIQDLVKLDQTKQAERLAKQREVAQPEPSTGGSSLPAAASREQVLQAAEENAKKFAKQEGTNWETLPGNEKQARIITQTHRLQRK